ncbi:hypothetical protein H171_4126 [[Clostridium] celerecrescens 18A]|uniref:Uncharacterized protein n=2 Tax=Lacrimispora celerecrescens TaxID=29354 RepID=A0A2M8ZAQ6_9FIRM|nr:hypothetical protein H171_4126 [[Clostridium] celerecrescens 18A]
MIGFWKKIENDGYDGFLVILFKLGNLKKQRRKIIMENRFCLQMVSCGEGCCGNGGSENVYSTEETVCGKWIDGKPIYRKVISGTLAANSGNSIAFANVPELNIDRVINLYGNMVEKQNVQITLQTSYNRTNGLFAAINMVYNNTTKNIDYHFLNNEGTYSGCTAYVVIEYTKQ